MGSTNCGDDNFCEGCANYEEGLLPYPTWSYMSYYFSCHTNFSDGQILRMHWYLESYRSELISEPNLIQTGVNYFLSIASVDLSQNCSDICGGVLFANIEFSGELNNLVLSWTDPNDQVVATTPMAMDVCGGNYTISVNDPEGCQISQDISVPQISQCCSELIFVENVFPFGLHLTSENQAFFSALMSSGPNSFGDDLIVESGVDWAFNNGECFFYPETSMVIREEALASFSNSTLQGCNSKWQGIQIESSTATEALPGGLGMNDCVVKDALVAIYTSDSNHESIDGNTELARSPYLSKETL